MQNNKVQTRKREEVEERVINAKILSDFGMKNEDIAKRLNVTRTTVIHYLKRHEQLIINKDYKIKYEDLENRKDEIYISEKEKVKININKTEIELRKLKKQLLLLLLLPFFLNSQTIEEVEQELIKNEVYFASETIKIIKLETGHLTSNFYKKNNNLFGMKFPRKRKTLARNNNGFAKYENWQESIKDFKLWQEWNLERRSFFQFRNYFEWLVGCGFNKEKGYINKLNKL